MMLKGELQLQNEQPFFTLHFAVVLCIIYYKQYWKQVTRMEMDVR